MYRASRIPILVSVLIGLHFLLAQEAAAFDALFPPPTKNPEKIYLFKECRDQADYFIKTVDAVRQKKIKLLEAPLGVRAPGTEPSLFPPLSPRILTVPCRGIGRPVTKATTEWAQDILVAADLAAWSADDKASLNANVNACQLKLETLHLAALELANESYLAKHDSADHRRDLGAGMKVVQSWDDEKTGFRAVLVEIPSLTLGTPANPIVTMKPTRFLAIAGTRSLQTAIADLSGGRDQFLKNRESVSQAIQDSLAKGFDVVITGHSLGGNLAQATGFYAAIEANTSRTPKPQDKVNAPSSEPGTIRVVTWNAYSGDNLLALAKEKAGPPSSAASYHEAGNIDSVNQTVNYRIDTDLVSVLSTTNAGEVRVISDAKTKSFSVLKAHSLSRFGEKLQRDGKLTRLDSADDGRTYLNSDGNIPTLARSEPQHVRSDYFYVPVIVDKVGRISDSVDYLKSNLAKRVKGVAFPRPESRYEDFSGPQP